MTNIVQFRMRLSNCTSDVRKRRQQRRLDQPDVIVALGLVVPDRRIGRVQARDIGASFQSHQLIPQTFAAVDARRKGSTISVRGLVRESARSTQSVTESLR